MTYISRACASKQNISGATELRSPCYNLGRCLHCGRSLAQTFLLVDVFDAMTLLCPAVAQWPR